LPHQLADLADHPRAGERADAGRQAGEHERGVGHDGAHGEHWHAPHAVADEPGDRSRRHRQDAERGLHPQQQEDADTEVVPDVGQEQAERLLVHPRHQVEVAEQDQGKQRPTGRDGAHVEHAHVGRQPSAQGHGRPQRLLDERLELVRFDGAQLQLTLAGHARARAGHALDVLTDVDVDHQSSLTR
jgi:hypothetical protein